MMVLKFTEGLGLIENGITECEDNDWNEQGAATTRHGIMRLRACCQEILKEERSLSCHTSVLYFFKLSSGTHASPPVLEMIQMTCLEFCKKCLSLNCNLFVMFNIFCTFFVSINIYFLLGQSMLFGTTLPNLVFHLWENLFQNYVVSNNSSVTLGINWGMTVKNILHRTGTTCTVAVRNHCQARQFLKR